MMTRPIEPTPAPTDADLRRAQRERLISAIEARGYRLPQRLRGASLHDIAKWYDEAQRAENTAGSCNPPRGAEKRVNGLVIAPPFGMNIGQLDNEKVSVWRTSIPPVPLLSEAGL